MAVERSDAELLASVVAADFAVFYRRHRQVVTSFVGARVAGPEVVFDLVAETFAQALEHRVQYDADRGSAVGWLIGIARHLLFDASRRGRVDAASRRRLGMARTALDDDQLALVEESGRVDLAAALASLSATERDAVLLRVVEDAPYERVAREIGCSEQVARKRVSRGLAKLRRRLDEADERPV
jgi:RNA polymerase sigma-70 factor (ECF subfamily)